MIEKMEEMIKAAYKSWKSLQSASHDAHPDEETMACFLDGLLSEEESRQVKAHLINCPDCCEAFALSLDAGAAQEKEVPQEALTYIKEMLPEAGNGSPLEIILRFREKAIEIIKTTGDVLFGQEVIAASTLRTRKISDFSDEVAILKDFKDLRVEARIQNRPGNIFDLKIMVRHKQTQKAIKDLRITLIRDGIELESYLTDSGGAGFEHLPAGKYRLEISGVEANLAEVSLEIKG